MGARRNKMEFTWSFCLFVFLVQFASFFVKGIAGFGDPLISSPMLSLTSLKNNQITPMNLVMSVPLNGYIAYKNRKSFSIKTTLPMVVCILIGMIPGMLTLKYFTGNSSWILKAILGALIFGIGIEMLTRKQSAQSHGNPIVMAIVSFFSGLTAGLYGINLFFVAYIERTGYINRSQFRGQMCFIFFIENVFRFISYIIIGMYTLDIVKLTLVSAVGVVCGMFAGGRVDRKLSEATVKRIIIFVFMIAGLSTLIKAAVFKI